MANCSPASSAASPIAVAETCDFMLDTGPVQHAALKDGGPHVLSGLLNLTGPAVGGFNPVFKHRVIDRASLKDAPGA
ncbi:hypothetical protein [Halomonas sp. LBP4]|uniref:hypothetical protein n=1 Tax=Halomonas sp. LBP4 TaxID=2044917 RepID=UPI000D75A420|nr:hypothetical protein [Halomonas sp. LBP4]PXX94742.1 hypothetical protein CR157_21175 [Halomonas sp. LBP4]